MAAAGVPWEQQETQCSDGDLNGGHRDNEFDSRHIFLPIEMPPVIGVLSLLHLLQNGINGF